MKKTLKTQPLSDISKTLIEKSLRELSAPEKPVQKSRVWQDSKGYQYLGVWQNAALLRVLTRKFTLTLPLWEKRLKAQMDDCARSQKRNLEEGFKRATTSEHLDFIGFSQGSLEEVKGDIRDATDDGFLASKPGSGLAGIGINLADLNEALRPGVKGDYGNLRDVIGEDNFGPVNSSNPPIISSKYPLSSYKTPIYSSKKQQPDSDVDIFHYRPLTEIYPPLAKIQADDLTYEMFMELINKTDFLLRKLVESLEKKLSQNQKAYQIDRARIQDKFRKR